MTLYWKRKRKGEWIEEPIHNDIPLYPVENGFGYYGILLCDISTGKVQCHLCGEFFKALGNHLCIHRITASEYKSEFELGNIGLCSVNHSQLLSQNAKDTGLGDGGDISRLLKSGDEQIEYSLRSRLVSIAANKREDRNKKLSKSQKESYKKPERYQEAVSRLNKIRPNLKGIKRSDAYKEKMSESIKAIDREWHLDKRKKAISSIVNFLIENGASVTRDIVRGTGYSSGTTRYWIKILAGEGIVATKKVMIPIERGAVKMTEISLTQTYKTQLERLGFD